eukprot:PhF_6_TR13458/c0_g1_i5/m.21567
MQFTHSVVLLFVVFLQHTPSEAAFGDTRLYCGRQNAIHNDKLRDCEGPCVSTGPSSHRSHALCYDSVRDILYSPISTHYFNGVDWIEGEGSLTLLRGIHPIVGKDSSQVETPSSKIYSTIPKLRVFRWVELVSINNYNNNSNTHSPRRMLLMGDFLYNVYFVVDLDTYTASHYAGVSMYRDTIKNTTGAAALAGPIRAYVPNVPLPDAVLEGPFVSVSRRGYTYVGLYYNKIVVRMQRTVRIFTNSVIQTLSDYTMGLALLRSGVQGYITVDSWNMIKFADFLRGTTINALGSLINPEVYEHKFGFSQPGAIRIDCKRNVLFVIDRFHNQVQVVNITNKSFILSIGTGEENPANFTHTLPADQYALSYGFGLALIEGNLYFTDAHDRISRTELTTQDGNYEECLPDDGVYVFTSTATIRVTQPPKGTNMSKVSQRSRGYNNSLTASVAEIAHTANTISFIVAVTSASPQSVTQSQFVSLLAKLTLCEPSNKVDLDFVAHPTGIELEWDPYQPVQQYSGALMWWLGVIGVVALWNYLSVFAVQCISPDVSRPMSFVRFPSVIISTLILVFEVSCASSIFLMVHASQSWVKTVGGLSLTFFVVATIGGILYITKRKFHAKYVPLDRKAVEADTTMSPLVRLLHLDFFGTWTDDDRHEGYVQMYGGAFNAYRIPVFEVVDSLQALVVAAVTSVEPNSIEDCDKANLVLAVTFGIYTGLVGYFRPMISRSSLVLGLTVGLLNCMCAVGNVFNDGEESSERVQRITVMITFVDVIVAAVQTIIGVLHKSQKVTMAIVRTRATRRKARDEKRRLEGGDVDMSFGSSPLPSPIASKVRPSGGGGDGDADLLGAPMLEFVETTDHELEVVVPTVHTNGSSNCKLKGNLNSRTEIEL